MNGDYREICLDQIWKKADEGLIASQLHEHIKRRLGGDEISRTTILLFLNRLCRDGVLRYREETCRGGTRRRYFPRKSREEYEKSLVREAILKIFRSQPKYAAEAFIQVLKGERLGPNVSWSLLGFLMSRDQTTYMAMEQALGGLSNPIHA